LADIKFGVKNILLVKIKPKKTIYELKIKNESKMISGNKNIFLAFM
jgi:hypothetical protein